MNIKGISFGINTSKITSGFLIGIFLLVTHSVFATNSDSLFKIWENPENSAKKRYDACFAGIEVSYAFSPYKVCRKRIDRLEQFVKDEPRKLANVLQLKSNIAFYYDYWLEAMESAQHALILYKEVNDELNCAAVLQNIGELHIRVKDVKHGYNYLLKSKKLFFKLNNYIGLTKIYASFFDVEIEEKNFDKAALLLDSAFMMYEKADTDSIFLLEPARHNFESGLHERRALIQSTVGNYIQAKSSALKAFDLSSKEKGNAAFRNLEAALLLVRICIKLDELQGAEEYLNHAKELTETFGNVSMELRTFQGFYELEKARGNHEKALFYLELSNKKESEQKSNNGRLDLARQQYKFEYRAKLSRKKLEAEKKLSAQKLEELHQRYVFIGLIIFLLLTTAIVIMAILGRNKRRQAQLLQELNELKNKLLTKMIRLDVKQDVNVLDKELLERSAGASLNESDWKVIKSIYSNPLISIREIAEEVSLSLDGTSSVLKKLYRIFKIEGKRNKKMDLIVEISRICNAGNEPLSSKKKKIWEQ